MNNIFVRCCDLPHSVRGFVVRQIEASGDLCYTILLNARLSYEQQQATYIHEVEHIKQGDFDSDMTVDQIEAMRHG